MRNTDYVIKGRFTGGPPGSFEEAGESAAYLGRFGRWCSLAEALTFSSVTAGEAALQETWSRLRNAGERSVILSLMELPSHTSGRAHNS